MPGTRESYDAWHRTLATDRDATTPWHDLVRKHLSLERDVCGKRILEVGCGRGGFSTWLAVHAGGACRLVAMDISPVAIRKGCGLASQQELQGIAWVVGDIHCLPHPAGTFDTVISCETVEHVYDPARALVELARVLRPGGRLFLTTPNYLGIMGLYRVYLRLVGRRYTEVGQPINRLTTWPRTLRWVSGAGLRVTRIDGIGHYLLRRGHRPIRLAALDRVRSLTRWTALHTLIVAQKP